MAYRWQLPRVSLQPLYLSHHICALPWRYRCVCVCACIGGGGTVSVRFLNIDEVAEWLTRWTANLLCSARVDLNPILVDPIFITLLLP